MSKKRSAWSSHARWSETTAREALNALASSALGPEAFARQHGFSGQRLRQWSKRLGVPLPRRQREERSTALLPVFVRQAEAVPVQLVLMVPQVEAVALVGWLIKHSV